MRAEKRKKNAPKELARLKQALSLDKKGEATMTDIQEIATVVPADKIKKQTDADMVEVEGEGEWDNMIHRESTAFILVYFTIHILKCLY